MKAGCDGVIGDVGIREGGERRLVIFRRWLAELIAEPNKGIPRCVEVIIIRWDLCQTKLP